MAYELCRVLLARYVRRYWVRAVAASGTLDDLLVTVEEVQITLGQGIEPPVPLPSDETLARRLAAERAARADRDLDDPAIALADRAGLDDDDLALLEVLVALQVHPTLLRTATFAWADFAIKQPTVVFMLELLADDDAHRARLEARLTPDAPLRRHALIRLGQDRAWHPQTPLLQRPVSVPDGVIRALRGAPPGREGLPPGALGPARPPDAELILPPHARVLRAVQAIAGQRDLAPLLLLGPPGTGRRTLASVAARQAGRPLWVLDVAALDAEPLAFEAQITAALRDTLLADAILLVRADPLDADRAAILWRRARLTEAALILTARAGSAARLAGAIPGLRVIEPDDLPPATRRALFERLLNDNAFSVDATLLERFVDTYRLTPGDVNRALADARVEVDGPALDAGQFDRAVRRQVRTHLADLARRVTTTQTWDDLVLGAEQRAALDELVAHARHKAQVFESWGLGAKVGGRGEGLGCLFSGAPGTGKTMSAALIAQSLGLDLFQVDLARVVDKYVGETEKNLARLFAEAARLPVVLLFDEADSLFATRTKVESSNDRYANLEVNYLLQLMERHAGICILTTNLESSIDTALMRRLRFRVHFPLPGPNMRRRLWRAMLPERLPRADDVDLDRLARRFEMSGALIRNAVVRAAFLAAAADRPVDQAMLEQATRAELREMGRLASG